ncbi:MAG TPA: BMC domain-containing protein [Bdellovibrionales bacterium]|nr:BMC domain-containing protein [Bdellovibrionales bacterium]
MQLFGPAVGIFEIASLARGYALMDRILKKAPVKILEASYMTPGKFFILFNGDEASVHESFHDVLQSSKKDLLDSVLIPNLHEQVLPGLYGQLKTQVTDSVAVVETASMASGLIAADRSIKDANVTLIEIRSSRGIGGKCLYFVTGRLEEAQASVEAAERALHERGTLLHTEVIANPHEDFLQYFNLSGAV